eukprot:1312841-Rhodomonas_salina.1
MATGKRPPAILIDSSSLLHPGALNCCLGGIIGTKCLPVYGYPLSTLMFTKREFLVHRGSS